MTTILESLSNREISLLLWLAVMAIVFSFYPSIRNSVFQLLKLFLGSIIGVIFAAFAVYVAGIIYLLYKAGYWETALLKDTLFWFVSVATVLFFKINSAKNTSFFKDIFFESVKWTILFEFIINFYDFKLWVEIVLTPILLVILLTQAYSEQQAEKNPEYKQTSNVLRNVSLLIFLGIIAYSFYKTVTEYSLLLTWDSLHSFLLPPIFTILIIPFLYMLAVYSSYEHLFVRIRFLFNDSVLKKRLKKEIIRNAGLNLDKISRIDKRFNKFEAYHSTDIAAYIMQLAQKQDLPNTPS